MCSKERGRGGAACDLCLLHRCWERGGRRFAAHESACGDGLEVRFREHRELVEKKRVSGVGVQRRV